MKRCWDLTIEAKKQGESSVGSMVVKGDKVISEAHEATVKNKDITRHAEIVVINKAVKKIGKDLSDCTLITTHEPCVMCSYVIRFHKIERVIYDQSSRHLGGINSSFPILTTSEVPGHWSSAPEIINLSEK